jgi:hypothetical protein
LPTHARWVVVVVVALLLSASCAAPPSVNNVLVHASDYTFSAPDSLPAGPTAFGLMNSGKVPHEVIIAGLQPGATLDEIVRRDRADSTWRHLRYPPSGILTADPGETTPGQLLITLEAGRDYILVCNFQDSDSAPVHMHAGMVRVVKVY